MSIWAVSLVAVMQDADLESKWSMRIHFLMLATVIVNFTRPICHFFFKEILGALLSWRFKLLIFAETSFSICITCILLIAAAHCTVLDKKTIFSVDTFARFTQASRFDHMRTLTGLCLTVTTIFIGNKWWLAWLRHRYAKTAMAEKIYTCQRQMRVLEAIQEHPSYYQLKSTEKDDSEGADLDVEGIARGTFAVLKHPGQTLLTPGDFERFFKQPLAEANSSNRGRDLFDLFDEETKSGVLDEQAWIEAVQRCYASARTTQLMLEYGNKLIDGIESVLNGITWVLAGALLLGRYFPRGYQVVLDVALVAVGYSYMTDSVAMNALNALLFALVEHPMDVGDVVVIDGQRLIVRSVGLLRTAFERADTKALQYRPTKNLIEKAIWNGARSRHDKDVHRMRLPQTCSLGSLGKIQEGIKVWLAAKDADFTGIVTVMPIWEERKDEKDFQAKHAKDDSAANSITVKIEALYRIKDGEDAIGRISRHNSFQQKVASLVQEHQ